MKIIANYTTQPDDSFPLDCETMQYIADNQSMAEILGNMAGDKVILQGCEERNASASDYAPGYVFLRTSDYPAGEVLYFEGGSTAGGVYVKKEDVQVNASGNEYPKAYTRRSLACGIGDENYAWSEFASVSSNRDLDAALKALRRQLDAIESVPVGTIMIWPGENPPSESYLPCHGQTLQTIEYPLLYMTIGTLYGGFGSLFRLPDLRGRFVVGYDGSEYGSLGKTGGLNKVALSVDQMPVHSHDIENTLRAFNANLNSSTRLVARAEGTANNATPATRTAGAGKAHENRPPYTALNYIIKVK